MASTEEHGATAAWLNDKLTIFQVGKALLRKTVNDVFGDRRGVVWIPNVSRISLVTKVVDQMNVNTSIERFLKSNRDQI